jgi:leucyl aminopeptidase
MSVPSFTISPTGLTDADTITVLGLHSSKETPVLWADPEYSAIAKTVQELEAPASAESLTRVPNPEAGRPALVIAGLGNAPISPATLREVAGATVRKLAGKASVEFAFSFESAEQVIATLEGALIGAYNFTRYRHASIDAHKSPVASIHIRTAIDVPADLMARAQEKALAMALVKDLVNTPANDLYPESFADIAAELCADDPSLHLQVWDEAALAKDGFGGILGVGLGSERGPRLVKISYAPTGASTHIALVGKGITFDTGGLSLKSGPGMMGMKYDMTGAATALGVIRAASHLALPVRVTAWLCLAENMPSGRATRPNDILTIRGGKTVEVLNTDAEGRLVLADGLVAASEEQPDLIIDIATLTGAATTALGTRTVGVMGNTAQISHLVEVAGTSGETFWHMPLPSELRPLLNSDVADIANVKPGNTAGGMLIAACFLRDFVGNKHSTGNDEPQPIDWIHLDIAGTANNGAGAYGFTGAGPTGVSVRALIDYLASRA